MSLKKFILIAVFMILLTSSFNIFANERSSDLISNGRIVYTNGTPADASDDVIIYDSDDLQTLELKIKNLASHMTLATDNLK